MKGHELEPVYEMLVSCFDADSFEQFLLMRLDKHLWNIVGPGPFGTVVFKLLRVAEREGWDALLIAKAAEYIPGKKDLKELAQKYAKSLAGQIKDVAQNESMLAAYDEYGLAPRGLPQHTTKEERGGLEKLIDPQNGMVPAALWLERALACQFSVCRVEINSAAKGTGFLVGPNAVLTNHHVVARAIEKPQLIDKIVLRFDHKLLRDGTILSGTQVKVRKILDSSPATPGELAGNPEPQDPTEETLDYALLETEGTPGSDPVSIPGASADGPKRGWIRVPDAGAVIDPDPYGVDMPVLIVQHPLAKPLSLAIEWKSMLRQNDAKTRVRHRTNTEAGSSGSPTFDRNWNLIALHHYGDPGAGHPPKFNQGVPIAAIRHRLTARGLEHFLGGDC
jgi:trypsin-like peptidase/effector-associated domain 1 (EAD1)-containing protein